MDDIGQLILGGSKPAGKEPPGDSYRFKNLQPNQIEMATKRMGEMGLNPRDIFTNPDKFDSYPIELRRRFFEMTTGESPRMGVAFEQVPARSSGDAVGDLILGRETKATERKVGKVKPSAQPSATPTSAEVPRIDASGQVMDTASARPTKKSTSVVDFAKGVLTGDKEALAAIKPDIVPAGEAALSLGTSAVVAPIAAGEQLVRGGVKPGAPDFFGKRMEQFTYQPRTPEAKGALEELGKAFEASKLPPVLTPEATTLAGTRRAGVPGKDVPAIETTRIEPSIGKPRISYAEFQAQLEAKKAGGPAPVLPPAPKVQTPTMPAPTITQPFPEIKYAPKGAVNLPEQEVRKGILSRIGLQNARQSSITGDGFAAANEFQTSQVDAPVGQLYRDTLANERSALENFGTRIVKRTGGTLGLDETALYDRGSRIARPFDDFKGVLQSQMNQAYDQAKVIAGNQPVVNPNNLQRFLDTDSNFTVNDKFMSLRRGIQAHLKENNLLTPEGRVKPMTVEQAENLRKYINSNWNNERSGIIGRLKDKIDNDVTKVAGEDVYKKARDIRTKIARLLDDPKGVAKIMDYDPQSPMNRAVPFEKIASTVERMSVDQQRHLIKLLKEMPDEVRPQADAAIAEIRAQFANRILQEGSKNKGQWNASNVTKYLNDNNRKLSVLMEDPEIAQMVKDLHDAGHILKYDADYPGAAIQAHNLIRLGAAPLLGTIGGATGTAIGGSMFGPGGAALGGTVGATMGAQRGVRMAEKSALKRAQKKMVPLKDIGKGK